MRVEGSHTIRFTLITLLWACRVRLMQNSNDGWLNCYDGYSHKYCTYHDFSSTVKCHHNQYQSKLVDYSTSGCSIQYDWFGLFVIIGSRKSLFQIASAVVNVQEIFNTCCFQPIVLGSTTATTYATEVHLERVN